MARVLTPTEAALYDKLYDQIERLTSRIRVLESIYGVTKKPRRKAKKKQS